MISSPITAILQCINGFHKWTTVVFPPPQSILVPMRRDFPVASPEMIGEFYYRKEFWLDSFDRERGFAEYSEIAVYGLGMAVSEPK